MEVILINNLPPERENKKVVYMTWREGKKKKVGREGVSAISFGGN